MIIITSAAYVGQEFRSELGKIPPCMLPIGNRRLFEHQADALGAAFGGESVHLSLPEDCAVSEKDCDLFARLGIDVVRVPEGLSLSESLLYVINSIGVYEGILRILHGDTLILGFPPGNDVIGTAKTRDDYGSWEVEEILNTEEVVWSGYFSFSHIRRLVRALTISRDNFAQAIRSYSDATKEISYGEVKSWYDLGHVNTYFKSRAQITTERAFNSITIKDGCVLKTGTHGRKIQAEANWFKSLPASIKRYTPQLLEEGQRDGTPYYLIEYLYFSPLNELFVHARNAPFFWKKIFDLCDLFFTACRQAALEQGVSHQLISAETNDLFAEKTFSRLNEFSIDTGLDMQRDYVLNGTILPSVYKVASQCISLVGDKEPVVGILHGDFCFSNILYNPRANDIKVIDPRGLNSNEEMTIHGDLRYDLGKLTHSVIGLYDFILAGAFTCEKKGELNYDFCIHTDSRIKDIQEIFMNHRLFSENAFSEIAPVSVLLFLSMLPLHKDSFTRQEALLANAMRLFSQYVEV